VEIIVCFSWALGPNNSYSSFSLAVYVCLKNTIVVTKKAKKL